MCVHPKGDQSWVFIGRTDAKAETPVLWPPHAKSWLIGKDSDVGRDWGQEEKGTTEDEMAGLYHRLDGHEFEWTPGVGDGQGGLVCCNSRGHKESDRTERLNWTEATNFLGVGTFFFFNLYIMTRKINITVWGKVALKWHYEIFICAGSSLWHKGFSLPNMGSLVGLSIGSMES